MFEAVFLESPNIWDKARGWRIVSAGEADKGRAWEFVGEEWPSLRFALALRNYFNEARLDAAQAQAVVAELQAPRAERRALGCRDGDAFRELVFLLRDGEAPQEALDKVMAAFLEAMRAEAEGAAA